MNEKKLVELARKREVKAISKLYDENIKYIYRFVYYKTSHKEIAEDITSEVFVRAFEKIDGFKGNSSFRTWIYTIAKNLIIEWYRNKEKETALIYEPEAKNDAENPLLPEEGWSADEAERGGGRIETDTRLIDGQADTENGTDTKKEELLKTILNNLDNEQYQKVLELRFLMNFSIKETAQELKISESNVKVIQNRALKKANKIAKTLHLSPSPDRRGRGEVYLNSQENEF